MYIKKGKFPEFLTSYFNIKSSRCLIFIPHNTFAIIENFIVKFDSENYQFQQAHSENRSSRLLWWMCNNSRLDIELSHSKATLKFLNFRCFVASAMASFRLHRRQRMNETKTALLCIVAPTQSPPFIYTLNVILKWYWNMRNRHFRTHVMNLWHFKNHSVPP